MGTRPSKPTQEDIQLQQEEAESKRKEAEEQKKLEKERIAQERARFGGAGGSIFTQDQKQTLGG